MSIRFSDSSFDEFHNHYEDDDMTDYQPPTKNRRYSDISQDMFDSYITNFIEFLNTNESEVFEKVINPDFNQDNDFDKSKFHSLSISVFNKHGWEITTNDGKFTMNIPYDIIHRYTMKSNMTYPHRIAVCFYIYAIKNILAKKYDIQDYYEYDGPWGMVYGGDGYEITLFYK